MAIIADVHTDSNTDICLEEGVGYPLEIFVIVNNDGYTRLSRGAVFSYYEFSQPISNRLTDEEWRNMLEGENPPELPLWYTSFMNTSEPQPEFPTDSPANLFNGEFTGMKSGQQSAYPRNIFLHQNFPNPFNPETTIRIELPERMTVNLIIYNVLGRKVCTLYSGNLTQGHHEFVWDGTDRKGVHVTSGIYFYKLETDDMVLVKKMFLLR
jgi:hypothetical protein